MPRLVFVVNNPDFLVSHRLVLVRGAVAAGYDVHAVAPPGPGVEMLQRAGVEVHSWALSRKGQRVLAEAKSVADLVGHYRRLAPDVVHHVTIKPVLYGSAAARVTGVPGIVNAVSGFGYVFLAQGVRAEARRRAVAAAYRMALSSPRSVCILQNDDDEADLRRFGALGAARVVKIRGSGVDLDRFSPSPEPDGPPVVVLPARLLRDKGVLELVAAARVVRSRHPTARFVLVGGVDEGNPAAVAEPEVRGWVAEGAVEWWGHRADMADVFRQATIVCLPSYREGMPKALLEAAASRRALVTTDVPGCRDAVDGGRAGLLVPARDANALARAVTGLIEEPARREALADAARRLAEARFDERAVLAAHLEVYASLVGR